ncbi:MAG: MotA/TolQ/ExbB proton channel family protein [Myxococcota bacterium]|nr:MotA/TolQ/ExbB proton channel family protein [Myxococcota bacterium]
MTALLGGTDFWGQGGPVILFITLASILALGVFFARLWALQRSRVVPGALVVEVKDLVKRELLPDAMTVCRMRIKKDNSPLARVYLAGLKQAGKARDEIKEFLSEVGRHEGMHLSRGLAVLETVAIVAPLLGLLGTVWGMIDVFQAIETQGVGNAPALAGGIGTALYTTLAGLLVAIPVRVGHSIIQSRVDLLVMEMEEEALSLLDLLANPSPGPKPAEDGSRTDTPTGPRAVSTL